MRARRSLFGPTMRIKSENGFTLAELLVTVLIIGMLAGVALPAFLGQEKKGLDTDAKANTRNAVSTVEQCYSETGDFTRCDTKPELEAAGTRLGTQITDTVAKQAGAVSVDATSDTYTIVGYSRSHSTFVISKAGDGTVTRNW